VSPEISRFWQHLRSTPTTSFGGRSNPAFDTDSAVCLNLWFGCWKAAAMGALGQDLSTMALSRTYMHLPNVKKVAPDPCDVLEALRRIQAKIQSDAQRSQSASKSHSNNSNSSNSSNDLVTYMIVLADVVRSRLNSPESLSLVSDTRTAVASCTAFVQAYGQAMAALTPAFVQDFARLQPLYERVGDLHSYLNALKTGLGVGKISGNDVPALGANDLEAKWRGWIASPTLSWLQDSSDSSWLITPGLTNVYADAAEYGESLLRLWTLLAFYWGAGAVWPKCRQGQSQAHGKGGRPTDGSDICGAPLLCSAFSAGGRHKATCCAHIRGPGQGVRVCGKPAQWMCHRHNHDALCATCLSMEQERLVGRPGSSASTDVYDATVRRESSRGDGAVFHLGNLKSRKPPKIEPNWLTSYRLQCSALVAIVPLDVSCEPLRPKASVLWGEIVPTSFTSNEPDASHRRNGNITVRLLSRADCAVLRCDTDIALDVGAPVAILDLRVFVPEVVSVLSTFADPGFPSELAQIPFIERILGAQPSPPVPPIQEDGHGASLGKSVLVAIQQSEIECVRSLPEAAKAHLSEQICALRPVKTLRGTQLEAFMASLHSAAHCTQGPPGTGKSYVGVCLVLALNEIRKAAMAQGHNVGPIVALSYKNHSLDEFLCDVVNANPREFKPTALIRCGKPEHPQLLDFTERNSPAEKRWQNELRERIGVQRFAKG